MDTSSEIERLRAELVRLREEFRTVSELGMRLATGLDPVALLPAIVTAARHLTRSEAGSLYVRRGDVLVFEVAQNDRLDRDHDGEIDDVPRIELPLDDTSLAGLAAAGKQTLNIDDVRTHASFSRAAKNRFHYEVVSMLVVPLVDHRGEVLGVLQLMNALDENGGVRTYDAHAAYASEVLAAHAATAMEIAHLYSELHEVYESLVRYSTSAIDARDPCTAGHTSRVGSYAMQVAKELARFDAAELREIRFAGIFHDVGKIGVRECVLTKADKVEPEGMQIIATRFQAAAEALVGRAAVAGQGESIAAARAQAESLEGDLAFLRRITVPGWVSDADLARLDAIAERTWTDWRGEARAMLTPDEHASLAVRRGSLTDAERREIQAHAHMSHEFLKQVPFPRDLARVPEIAWSHHEKMDGSGYPRGLSGDAILLQARIVSVVDVFDALTAEDRPYKKAMSPDRAMQVIEHECEQGAWDPEVVATLRTLVDRGHFVPRGHGVDPEPDRPFEAQKDAWR